MRLASYTHPGEPGSPRLAIVVADALYDVAALKKLDDRAATLETCSMRRLLAQGEAALETLKSIAAKLERDAGIRASCSSVAMHEALLLPPITDSEKFLCVGKNYRSHLEELQRTDLIKEIPTEPTGFIKLNSSLIGHNRPVVVPESVHHLDYEPELVFVIGKAGYAIREEDAFEYVVGITLLNDLTCRDTQKREVASGSRFWTAKNAPGFGPLGPAIVTMDEVRDPYDIWVSCSVNGQERMRVNTSEQIWRLPSILAHFSRLIPLSPGDMFSTGAPGGVAVGKPNAHELFLKPGDVVSCHFESPALTLRTPVIASPQ